MRPHRFAVAVSLGLVCVSGCGDKPTPSLSGLTEDGRHWLVTVRGSGDRWCASLTTSKTGQARPGKGEELCDRTTGALQATLVRDCDPLASSYIYGRLPRGGSRARVTADGHVTTAQTVDAPAGVGRGGLFFAVVVPHYGGTARMTIEPADRADRGVTVPLGRITRCEPGTKRFGGLAPVRVETRVP